MCVWCVWYVCTSKGDAFCPQTMNWRVVPLTRQQVVRAVGLGKAEADRQRRVQEAEHQDIERVEEVFDVDKKALLFWVGGRLVQGVDGVRRAAPCG